MVKLFRLATSEAMNIKVKSILAGLAFRQVAEFLKGVVFRFCSNRMILKSLENYLFYYNPITIKSKQSRRRIVFGSLIKGL